MKKHAKKLFSLSLALLLAFTCFLSYRQADAVEVNGEAGHFYVTSSVTDGWSYNGSTISITKGGTYKISKNCDCDEDTVHAGYQIKIEGSITVTLTIEDVQISNSSNAAMSIDGSAKVTLVLEGNNTFDSSTGTNNQHAGIEFNNASGSLEITSDTYGSLIANGGYASAGIGGNPEATVVQNITISGGIVIATGGEGGAPGIGGAQGSDVYAIKISGGIVTATGSDNAPGIGSSNSSIYSTIEITDGIVRAIGGTFSSAIGSGDSNCKVRFTISGGAVTAISDDGVAAIGNSSFSNDNVTVSTEYSNQFKYRSSSDAEFDETYYNGNNTSYTGSINITTSFLQIYDINYHTDGHYIVVSDVITSWDFGSNTISITGSDDFIISKVCNCDGVHSSYQIEVDNVKADIILDNVQIKNNSGAAMSIDDEATVTLVLVGTNSFISTDSYAGIQFNDSVSGSLTIIAGTIDGSVTATGGKYGAGIGGGRNQSTNTGYSGNNITITSGTVTATGGTYAAGIGAGGSETNTMDGGSASNITISGGTIIATGGSRGAGIGGSFRGSASITITGGNITANGGGSAPGIGGGYNNSGTTNITISGGNITATGEGAGIGAGIYASGSTTIDISGGTITATGAASSAGIGGGSYAYESASTIIMISGGTVTATAGSAWYGGGAGIGSGNNSEDSTTIEIYGGNITATGAASTNNDKGSAGIGSGYNNTGTTNINISGGTITATGGGSAAGIGDGMSSSGAEVIISNGSVKASSISNPTDGSGNEVYLLKIPNMLDINSVMVDDTQYSRSGNHWDESDYTDGTFYLYLTGEDHEVTAGGKNYRAVWDEGEKTLTLKEYVETPSATFIATDEDSGRLTNVDKTMKYSVDGGNSWISIKVDEIYDQNKTNITDVTTTNGIQIYIETETTISHIQEIEVTQAATPNVDSEDCTIDENGKITNVDDTMEYRKEGETEWTSISDEEEVTGLTGLSAGTYYVRVKASENVLASSPAEVTISAYVETSSSGTNGGAGDQGTDDGYTLLAGASGQIIVNTSAGSTSKED